MRIPLNFPAKTRKFPTGRVSKLRSTTVALKRIFKVTRMSTGLKLELDLSVLLPASFVESWPSTPPTWLNWVLHNLTCRVPEKGIDETKGFFSRRRRDHSF
jgi:hypothetical protein